MESIMPSYLTRRVFLASSPAALAAGSALIAGVSLPQATRPARSAGQKVNLAFIGCGIRRHRQIPAFLERGDVRVAAVCDVSASRAQAARNLVEENGGGRPEVYSDFRHVLDCAEVDAVVIATPEHWKCLITRLACEAGKDVYVEKPLALTIGEGRRMVEAARKHGRIVMIGTQQRSMDCYREAIEFLHSGRLGRISTLRSWNFENLAPEGYGNPPDQKPPAELDWDLWLGPAPQAEYNPNRFSAFHFFWDYGGGWQCDWGVHLFDVVHWAMKVDFPISAAGFGGKFSRRDNTEHPDTFEGVFEYPGFISLYSYRHGNGHEFEGMWYGNAFYGENGTLVVNRDGWRVSPEPMETHDISGLKGWRMATASGPGTTVEGPHQQKFIDAVKTRKPPDVGDIETGHRSTIPGHLANIAYRLGRKVYWDAAREVIKDDPEANKLLLRPYRSPWTLDV
jgi:predicted dehydrogenase